MTRAAAGPDPASSAAPHRGRWLLVTGTFLLGAIVVVIDQSTKAWAEAALSVDERIPLVGGLLGLQLAYNPGAAFSVGKDSTWAFTLIAVAAVVVATVFAVRVQRLAWAIVIGALGGAAASHAGDRLFRSPGFAQGHVVDFIAYGNWFIGNVADIVLVTAAVAAVLLTANPRGAAAGRNGRVEHGRESKDA